MKENTKFLWMYVGILFSFAIILILFAGLTQNSGEEKAEGIQNRLTSLTKEHEQLGKTNEELKSKNTVLESELTFLKSQNNQLVEAAESLKVIDDALYNASLAKDAGDTEMLNEILAGIVPESLTESQLYIYNNLIEE